MQEEHLQLQQQLASKTEQCQRHQRQAASLTTLATAIEEEMKVTQLEAKRVTSAVGKLSAEGVMPGSSHDCLMISALHAQEIAGLPQFSHCVHTISRPGCAQDFFGAANHCKVL